MHSEVFESIRMFSCAVVLTVALALSEVTGTVSKPSKRDDIIASMSDDSTCNIVALAVVVNNTRWSFNASGKTLQMTQKLTAADPVPTCQVSQRQAVGVVYQNDHEHLMDPAIGSHMTIRSCMVHLMDMSHGRTRPICLQDFHPSAGP